MFQIIFIPPYEGVNDLPEERKGLPGRPGNRGKLYKLTTSRP